MIWSQGEISFAMGSTAGVFLVPGIMGAIAAIFKVSVCLAVELDFPLLFLLAFHTCFLLFLR